MLRSWSKERRRRSKQRDHSSERSSTFTSLVKERRSFFGTKKSRSVETTDIGQTIGVIGLQVYGIDLIRSLFSLDMIVRAQIVAWHGVY